MSPFTISALLLVCVSSTYAYSAGAPESVCEDMVPKHPVDPQKSAFPYKISVSKNQVKGGETVDITIGGKNFKGFLIQVRDEKGKPVGEFQVSDSDKYTKALNCQNNKASAATHKNATDKKDFKLTWKAPASSGKYTVYATVAENGGVFWVKQPTEIIAVS